MSNFEYPRAQPDPEQEQPAQSLEVRFVVPLDGRPVEDLTVALAGAVHALDDGRARLLGIQPWTNEQQQDAHDFYPYKDSGGQLQVPRLLMKPLSSSSLEQHEQETLLLRMHGMLYGAIADMLDTTASQVQFHVTDIRRKLGTRSIARVMTTVFGVFDPDAEAASQELYIRSEATKRLPPYIAPPPATLMNGGEFPPGLTRGVRTDLGLTSIEGEVLALMALGLRNKEIAATCGRSEGTIKVHIDRLTKKLDESDRVSKVAVAMGIIRPRKRT